MEEEDGENDDDDDKQPIFVGIIIQGLLSSNTGHFLGRNVSAGTRSAATHCAGARDQVVCRVLFASHGSNKLEFVSFQRAADQ